MKSKIFENIRKKIPLFGFDFLPHSDLPRLRVLFQQKSGYSIKTDKDKCLQTIFGNKSVYGALMFFSGNKQKMRESDIKKIDLFNFNSYLDVSSKETIKIENNLFGHIFTKKYKPKEVIFLTDITINLENKDSIFRMPPLDYIFFIFDLELKTIVNVYSFEGLDISSNDKNYLYRLESLLKKDFDILNDKI